LTWRARPPGPLIDGDVHNRLEALLEIARSADARGEPATAQRTLSDATQAHARVHNPLHRGDQSGSDRVQDGRQRLAGSRVPDRPPRRSRTTRPIPPALDVVNPQWRADRRADNLLDREEVTDADATLYRAKSCAAGHEAIEPTVTPPDGTR
jgi:hypothetical protein